MLLHIDSIYEPAKKRHLWRRIFSDLKNLMIVLNFYSLVIFRINLGFLFFLYLALFCMKIRQHLRQVAQALFLDISLRRISSNHIPSKHLETQTWIIFLAINSHFCVRTMTSRKVSRIQLSSATLTAGKWLPSLAWVYSASSCLYVSVLLNLSAIELRTCHSNNF